MSKSLKLLLSFIAVLMLAGSVNAQIGITVTNPTNTTPNLAPTYTSLANAITALNGVTAMSGPVTFTMTAGTSEIAPPTGLSIGSASLNPVLSLTNSVTFVKSGGLVTLFAGVGTSTPGSAVPDGMLIINGADYITIDGLTFTDGNVANPATMEFGLGLFKFNQNDGASNNTIKNCVFNMQNINNASGTAPMFDGSVAILSINATTTAATTGLAPTTAAGTNSNNRFYTNFITGGNIGIGISGFAASTPFTAGDNGNDIGGTSLATGNTINNFGGAPAATNPAAGIRVNNVWTTNISYNTINNNNGAGTNHPSTLRGIYGQAGTSANITINNNALTLHGGGTTSLVSGIDNSVGSTAASNSVNINNNTVTGDYLTATTGVFYGIIQSSTAASVVMKGNSVNNISYSSAGLTGTGTVYSIYNNGAATNVNIRQNTVSNISRTGTTGGTTVGIYCSGGTTQLVTSNTVTNQFIDGTGTASTMYGIQTSGTTVVCDTNTVTTLNCVKSTGTGTLYGIYNGSVSTNENYNYNNVSGINHNGTGTTYGIFNTTTTGSRTVSNNIVNTVSTNGLTAAGINQGSSSPSIFKNKVYNISSFIIGGAPTVSGIGLSSVGTSGSAYIYNNIIGDIKAPNASSTGPTAPTIRGINITSATANSVVGVYNNSVYLNASTSGTNFATTAIWVTTAAVSTTAGLTLQNNAFVNLSTPAGTGFAVAYQRSSSTITNYLPASNNNLYYAGAPSASNLLFYDATNSVQFISALKSLLSPRDGYSVTENPTFLSTTASNANFLRVDSTVATRMESGGVQVGAVIINPDYFNVSRYPSAGYPNNPSYPATNPDIGANEFGGIPIDVNPPVISYSLLSNTGSLGDRTLSNVTISDNSGVPLVGSFMPRIYYTKNAGAYVSTQGSLTSGTAQNGIWSFTINAAAMGGIAANDVISYFVIAQDVNGFVTSNPSAGLSASDVNNVTTPPTSPNTYTITASPMSGTYTVGTALFNRIAGKNISFEERTRVVTREEPVYEELSAVKTGKTSKTSGINEPTGKKSGTRLVDVTETYSVLVENGNDYKGELYHELSDVERKQFNLSPDMAGIYLTITAAVSDLNLRGVSGNTVLSLTDAAYPSETYPITINSGSDFPPSSGATVTIKPAAGVSPVISGSLASAPLFKILNNYVTFDGSNTIGGTTKDMTITNTNLTGPNVIVIGSTGINYVDNVTLKNCIFINGINSSSAVIVSDGATIGNPGYFTNITIQNNSIQKAYIGMYINANTAGTSGVNVIGNDMSTSGANSVRFTGVYLQGIKAGNVTSNNMSNFDGTTSEDDNGIWAATGTMNVTIDKNYIGSLKYTGTGGYGAHGIQMSTGVTNNNNTIKNNQICNLSGDGWANTILGDNTHGIYLFSTQTGTKIYNNSINLSGNTLNQTGAMSYGITLGTGSTADVRNNCVVNNLGLFGATGLGSTCMFIQSDNSQLVNSDNNNYYCNPTGSGVKDIGKINAADYSTLPLYAVATTQDQHSVSGDPIYINNVTTDVVSSNPLSWVITGDGFPGLTDFDYIGNPRSPYYCSIGCFEITPVTTPPAATESGTIGAGNTTSYSIFNRTYATITWGVGGTLPGAMTSRFYSGVIPPAIPVGARYGYGYWEFVPDVQPTGGATYSIKIIFDDGQTGTILAPATNIELAKYDGSVWQPYQPGAGPMQSNVNYSAKTITVGGLTSFSLFALTDQTAPLPVELASFTSTIDHRNVELKWSTAAELNNSGFDVERKISGTSTWSKVGNVAGHGTSSVTNSYSFSERNLPTASYNYRLKQIDNNGNFKYYDLTNEVIIGLPTAFSISQNYPNPFNPTTKINYDLPFDSKVSIVLFDMTGRQVAEILNTNVTAGYQTVSFNASNLSSGTYFYQINASGGNQSFSKTMKMMLIK
ncbi:hypothetical protein BH10BAC5_BH10BAC5_07430 [soil metagenome]